MYFRVYVKQNNYTQALPRGAVTTANCRYGNTCPFSHQAHPVAGSAQCSQTRNRQDLQPYVPIVMPVCTSVLPPPQTMLHTHTWQCPTIAFPTSTLIFIVAKYHFEGKMLHSLAAQLVVFRLLFWESDQSERSDTMGKVGGQTFAK